MMQFSGRVALGISILESKSVFSMRTVTFIAALLRSERWRENTGFAIDTCQTDYREPLASGCVDSFRIDCSQAQVRAHRKRGRRALNTQPLRRQTVALGVSRAAAGCPDRGIADRQGKEQTAKSPRD